MGSFAGDHLRFLRVDGTWMPTLIFNDYMQIQMILDKERITGLEKMENELTKSMILRYQSGQPVTGNVAIVLGEAKTILWEEAIGETKKFHLFLHHVLTNAPDCLPSATWNKALDEALKLLDIPRVLPNVEVDQVGFASQQEISREPSAAELVLSPAASSPKIPQESSFVDTPTVNESVGDCWDREHIVKPVEPVAPVIASSGADSHSTIMHSTSTQDSGISNTQAEENCMPSTIDPGPAATTKAVSGKKNVGVKIAKVRYDTKHVSASKGEGSSKSLIRVRRQSPRQRLLKEVTFKDEPQTLPFPKHIPAAVVDDPSVMSEQEVAQEFKVPSTREVLPILSKLGYKNVKTMYYRPNCSGKDRKTLALEEGVHYFSSASDLRRFLCKRGVEPMYTAINDDLKEILQKWVRYCICPALRNESVVPREARTALSSAHTMLVKLGFLFRNPYYYLPGVTPVTTNGISLNGFEMDGPDGLWANLCRHGLPESCNFQNLTDADRLRLELYLADCPQVNTFEFIEETDISAKFAKALLEVSSKHEASTFFNENSIATPVAGNRMHEPFAVSATHTDEHGSIAPDSAVHTIVSFSSGVASVENRVGDGDEASDSHSKAESQLTMEPWKESMPTPSPAQADEKSIVDMCGGQQQGSPPRGNPTKMLFDETPADVIEKRKRIDAMQSKSPIRRPSTTQPESTVQITQSNWLPEDANHCTTKNAKEVPRSVDDSSMLTSCNLTLVTALPSTTHTSSSLSEEIEGCRNLNSFDDDNASAQSVAKKLRVSTPIKHSEELKNTASPDQDAMDKEMEGFSPPRMNEKGSPDVDDLVKTFDATLTSTEALVDNHQEPEHFLLTQEAPLDSSKKVGRASGDHTVGREGRDNIEGVDRMENDSPEVHHQAVGVEPRTELDVAIPINPSERGQIDVDDAAYEKWTQNMTELVSPEDKWAKVMRKMMNSGLKWQSGGMLSSWIYVFPGRRTKASGGILGHDFVDDEFDLKQLAFERFNWKGDDKFHSDRYARISLDRRAKRVLQTSPERSQKRKAETKGRLEHTRKQQRLSENHQATDCAVPPVSTSLSTPEMKETVGAKLLSCLRVLQTSHRHKKLANHDESKSSRFKDQVSHIEKFLEAAISSKRSSGHNKFKTPILYVCGSPGVGKTTAVDWCCDQAVKSVKNMEIADCDSLRICQVNGVCPGDAASSILSKIADGLDMTNKNVTMKSLAAFLKKTDEMVILVIDEVDEMVSSRSNSSLNSESEKTLRDLCKLASDPSCKVALIGISNAVDGLAATRLKMTGMMNGTKISFVPYGPSELVDLVVARIGSSIVHPKALEFLAAKVASKSGDARAMLNLVASAVSIRYDASTDGQLKERGLGQPVVTIRDAIAAAKATVKTYVDRINGLPEMAKMVLCVAVTLCCNSASNFTMQDLRKYCIEVTTHESLDNIDFDMFKQLVQHLVDQGLLLPNEDETNDIGGSTVYAVLDKPVHFGDQLHDVELAIADTLEGKPVYKKLIDSIKNLHPGGRATKVK